jgi:hypothetical protein
MGDDRQRVDLDNGNNELVSTKRDRDKEKVGAPADKGK